MTLMLVEITNSNGEKVVSVYSDDRGKERRRKRQKEAEHRDK